jgi:hypothetical protein
VRGKTELCEPVGEAEDGADSGRKMIPPTYKPKKKFMQLAIAEAKRARDRGDYPIGAVVSVRSSPVSLGNGKWLSRPLATG